MTYLDACFTVNQKGECEQSKTGINISLSKKVHRNIWINSVFTTIIVLCALVFLRYLYAARHEIFISMFAVFMFVSAMMLSVAHRYLKMLGAYLIVGRRLHRKPFGGRLRDEGEITHAVINTRTDALVLYTDREVGNNQFILRQKMTDYPLARLYLHLQEQLKSHDEPSVPVSS